ncbi:MAG: hypothetical protein M3082_20335, partial [Candidatus Dormibacteraeota bacterium]|nr:hypothetical protein [Candidatus Dormibacteraeota bacterium]
MNPLSPGAQASEVSTHASTSPGLARRTFVAVSFSSLASMVGRLSTIVATIFLAHLLTPRDFGIAAVGALALMVLLPLTDVGITRAV